MKGGRSTGLIMNKNYQEKKKHVISVKERNR